MLDYFAMNLSNLVLNIHVFGFELVKLHFSKIIIVSC